MFDERAALRLRLEQMKDAEERLLRELQKERVYIFNRLRELDQENSSAGNDSKEDVKYLETVKSLLGAPTEDKEKEQTVRSRRARPSRRSKTTKMRDAAVDVLKQHRSPIKGSELKKIIEERTGFDIANMTTFMNTIIKADPNIIKIGRGLYTYQQDNIDYNEPIYLGQEDGDGEISSEQ